jgi:site-specific recombinase XerC
MKMEEQSPPYTDELALFLKTVAGGQSAHTAQTDGQALAYLHRYLEASYRWTETTPMAELKPNMLQEFPTWLLQLELTGNIALVQEALGHQDPKTTRGYTRVKVEQIIDGVRALGKQERQERGEK